MNLQRANSSTRAASSKSSIRAANKNSTRAVRNKSSTKVASERKAGVAIKSNVKEPSRNKERAATSERPASRVVKLQKDNPPELETNICTSYDLPALLFGSWIIVSGQEPDNTKVNKRDRNRSEPTADQQRGNIADRDLTKENPPIDRSR